LKRKIVLISIAVFWLTLISLPVLAQSTRNFSEEDKPIYDDWNVCRTIAAAPDGYMKVSSTEFDPVILGESLGENASRAYQVGQTFAREYPDTYQRAEKIFACVRDLVNYTPDIDQFGRREFAQNADELATTVWEKGFALGDCEDYAILLATMYKGAGYRSAIAVVKFKKGGHIAALVYLPGYQKANRFLTVDGETGWVWAEATGRNNDLGWAPESCCEDNVKLLLTREVE